VDERRGPGLRGAGAGRRGVAGSRAAGLRRRAALIAAAGACAARRPGPDAAPSAVDGSPMYALALLVVQSLAQGPQGPVLEFPETGLDDPAAYEGYATRFFRDSDGNTFQVYVDGRAGRVVHVWADAANASAAFTVRDTAGRVVPLTWGGPGAAPSSAGSERRMRYALTAASGAVDLGWFVLGTMRQERDVQYARWHLRPFGDTAFILPELAGLVASLERLPPDERARHLALLSARDADELRGRLAPRVTMARDGTAWVARVEHTSLDGRNRMRVEVRGDAGSSGAAALGDRVRVRARTGERVTLDVTVTTDAASLTPLGRDRLFNAAFEDYYARERRAADSLRAALGPDAGRDQRIRAFRRFDRQVQALALLSYEEKLLASLPNYATYFGRDMMMSALMLEPIVSVDVQEIVIGSVLRKLSPDGQVSHEEALGGQAIREHAAEYRALIGAWAGASTGDSADAALARARALLGDLQVVRENYHMVDDDFQLPVLAARYLARPDVPAGRKRRFLAADAGSGVPRLEALSRNLAFVTALAGPYAERPEPTRLVSFFSRDDRGWFPGSWRDSRVGYGLGRHAMDVNAVWVPAALEATRTILAVVDTLGLAVAPAPAAYARDPAALDAAIGTWRGAWRHFEVRLDTAALRSHVAETTGALPERERTFWERRLAESQAAARPLAFLAVALDDAGRPVGVANTDPATALFLGSYTAEILAGARAPASVLDLLDVIGRPYPVGLFVAGLGPLVANDAYASAAVREGFRADLYHSPRVVWGREVNLLLLGLARQIAAAQDGAGRLRGDAGRLRAYVDTLTALLDRIRAAVDASGLRHNELWSYRIGDAGLQPVRYGTSSDIQLWNVTDLAVRFVTDGLPPRE